ncbi:MAG TPA: hypothetical protein VIC29_19810 [Steroidobacteraceae bacterium]
MSLSLLALIGYLRGESRPLHLILSGVSSAFLLLGIAVLYAGLGTLSFSAVTHECAGASRSVTRYRRPWSCC